MKVAVIGGGVMGESIVAGLLDSGPTSDGRGIDVAVAEQNPERAAELAQRHAITVTDVASAARDADVVVLAVKPHDIAAASETALEVLSLDTVVVSVAAGVTTEQLEGWLPLQQPVVRAMPNTPALVRAGVTAICAGAFATDQHMATVRDLLASVGAVVVVPEAQMDAVAAISGSGPAYVFLVVEALVEAGVRAGLPRALATELTVGTLAGSARLITESGEHPTVLRERVTSPGGTTAAALHQLEAHGLRAAFLDAVLANRDRSRELAAPDAH
jgi:pyrroline-5-carboxylate reductase